MAMRTIKEKIARDLYLLRVDDDRTRYFESIWNIPEGVTYNAYLLSTGDKVLLFDSWKRAYADRFIELLREIVDPRDIDCIVVHHMEQDHSGALPKILETNGNRAEVWGHPLSEWMFKSFYDMSPRFRTLKDGEEIALGEKEIRFVYCPWLHWPETMMSFMPDDGVLLSGDAFGAFSMPSTIFDDDENTSGYYKHVRKYLVDVIGNYSKHILNALGKLSEQRISPKIVAPAHGLVFKNRPELILDYYSKLASGIAEKGKVTVVYDSMYGSVERGISAAIDELKKRGANPAVYRFVDVESADIGEAVPEIIDSQAMIIGASTYENDTFPCMRYMLDLIVDKIKVGKPVLTMASHGWGGITASKIAKRLGEAGFKAVDSVDFRGQPTQVDIERIRKGVGLLLEEAGQPVQVD